MKRFIAILLLFIFVIPQAAFGAGKLQEQLKDINERIRRNKIAIEQKKEYEKVLTKKITNIFEAQQDVKFELDTVTMRLDNLWKQIKETKESIEKNQDYLTLKGIDIDKKRDEVSKLLTFIHKYSKNRFVDFIFSAKDFSELTSRTRFTTELLDGTIKVMNNLHEQSAIMFMQTEQLRKDKERLSELESQAKLDKDRLTNLRIRYSNLNNQYDLEIKTNKSLVKSLEDQNKKEQARIRDILRLIAEEAERNRKAREKSYKNVFTGTMLWPINGRIVSDYGMRIHPISNVWSMHEGIDITASMGTPIWAAENGIVDWSSWMYGTGYGNLVIISHNDKIRTFYAHLSRFNSKKGQVVKKGDLIGFVGSTGRSTGPHLHFEVRSGLSPTDPKKWLSKP